MATSKLQRYVSQQRTMDFKDEHQISVMLNRTIKGKVPPGYNWARYHAGFVQETMSPYALAANVYRGWAFCPVYEGARKQTNYREAWHIGFDFDAASLEQVSALGWVREYASFGYTTPSHTIENPKCRVVFIFDEPITDSARYRELSQALAWRFGQDGIVTDPACKDVLRLYFGSPKCEGWWNWQAFPLSAHLAFLRDWMNNKPKPVETKQTIVVAPAESLSSKFLEVAATKLLSHVESAPDGQKHHILCKIAYVFGGYVASGYYAENDVITWLEDAIHPRAADKNKATNTIMDCVAAGKEKPLCFEARSYDANLVYDVAP